MKTLCLSIVAFAAIVHRFVARAECAAAWAQTRRRRRQLLPAAVMPPTRPRVSI
jgi:hypothetical protein